MEEMKIIGRNCKAFRERLGYFQQDVADDLGYSKENISSFENGRNDNYKVLLWYVLKGIKIEELLKGVK